MHWRHLDRLTWVGCGGWIGAVGFVQRSYTSSVDSRRWSCRLTGTALHGAKAPVRASAPAWQLALRTKCATCGWRWLKHMCKEDMLLSCWREGGGRGCATYLPRTRQVVLAVHGLRRQGFCRQKGRSGQAQIVCRIPSDVLFVRKSSI